MIGWINWTPSSWSLGSCTERPRGQCHCSGVSLSWLQSSFVLPPVNRAVRWTIIRSDLSSRRKMKSLISLCLIWMLCRRNSWDINSHLWVFLMSGSCLALVKRTPTVRLPECTAASSQLASACLIMACLCRLNASRCASDRQRWFDLHRLESETQHYTSIQTLNSRSWTENRIWSAALTLIWIMILSYSWISCRIY